MVPTGRLSNLPSSFRAAYRDCVSDFLTADHRTFDSRAKIFTSWCSDDLRGLDDQQCLMILGTYTHDVKRGYNHEKRSDYAPDTIRGYLKAAHGYLQALLARDIYIMDPHHGGTKPRLHPFLGDQLAGRRRWRKPKPRYEPFTVDMFLALDDVWELHYW
mmetsp:Transcript_4855/g.11562  ORF Transcript_4855/g.11562 Transcript_4855/m.11562 type:complete len:159 (-) Transcript_4855:113-589(-)